MALAMLGGCLLWRPFLSSKLSDVEIDNDKDWAAFGITNLKELASSMTKGDILFFGGAKLEKLSPGSIGSMLTSHDLGNDPTWSYAE